MRLLTAFRWAAVLAVAILLPPAGASAAEPETLSYTGTFHMDAVNGFVGDDLAAVFANGHDHQLTLTLSDLAYSYESDSDEGIDEQGYYYYWFWEVRRIRAGTFDFEFSGPDADILNQVVSPQFESAEIEQWVYLYVDGRDPLGPGDWQEFYLRLLPPDSSTGITYEFSALGNNTPDARIINLRSGYWGELISHGEENLTFIPPGSSPPPPPPPTPPALNILDASVLEGNKGTTHVDVTVMLSASSNSGVSVKYATANGTAQKKSDYTATSGTLTIPAGQTQGTISIAIKADRKREKDETLSVQLSNAAGATISDGVATVTILNDD